MTTSKQFNNILHLKLAAASMGLAVILGALGAHALKAQLPVEKLGSFKTAVLYHIIHSLAILIMCIAHTKFNFNNWVVKLFWFGIILFSGSIYLLSTIPIHHQTWMTALGPITPLGGLCFIGAWIALAITIKPRN